VAKCNLINYKLLVHKSYKHTEVDIDTTNLNVLVNYKRGEQIVQNFDIFNVPHKINMMPLK
jgi:hypothetical protein